MTDKNLLEQLGPLDLTRPWAEINAQFVNLRAALGGMATPVPPYTEANSVTRRLAVTELDELWDRTASEHPDPAAKPFFLTNP
ncbi:hypothetical protein [Micromonospora aurantiaca (nom. illeg.)]|uniref:hypothetical protein n=1 Tax=Micromonospora aurantiaca (nom. illeg.) TaxID=47850 RepID=UPI00082793B5|nr:hypothetical protein [Micromonospora aurantiaca]SCL33025.1 hypothetical protein GA0070615_2181 [Micromonospora aurantiaca]